VADGEVVTVIDGIPDNRPYTINPMSYVGNAVILKHAEREFSFYAHLRLNSTRVKVGQKAVSGQVIGQCGNSGQSPAPHLHFSLVNTEVAYDARGFLSYFNNVTVTRPGLKAIQNDYTPLRGDLVQSQD
jgi:murein DD-endopeptidase MepM/ murein hydrolase activator NlpD